MPGPVLRPVALKVKFAPEQAEAGAEAVPALGVPEQAEAAGGVHLKIKPDVRFVPGQEIVDELAVPAVVAVQLEPVRLT
jgi:hypothetical protein